MPETITLGHVLMLLGILAGLYALWQFTIFLKHRDAGRGTPQYARRRDGRRYAVWSLIVAAALFALGCLTPLCEMAIA
jgi:di/tricarboxylate transporter